MPEKNFSHHNSRSLIFFLQGHPNENLFNGRTRRDGLGDRVPLGRKIKKISHHISRSPKINFLKEGIAMERKTKSGTKSKSKSTRKPKPKGPGRPCAACGRPIYPDTFVTFAAWFRWGTPEKRDLVHVRCRRVRVPLAARRQRRSPPPPPRPEILRQASTSCDVEGDR
jgi:hypothetical protein